MFGVCKEKEELWIPLIEKAWAKYLGSYQRADGGGSVADVFHTFTGTPTLRFTHSKNRNNETLKNKTWEILKYCDARDFMMGTGTLAYVSLFHDNNLSLTKM